MYLEEYAGMEYVLLRSMDEKIETFYEKGEAYFQTAGVNTKIEFPIVYNNGLTWLPVKQTAELFGKTVLYKNGITVIDLKMNQGGANNSSTLSGKLYETSDKGLLNQKEKDYWKGATWTGLKGAGWSLSTAPVTKSEYGKVYLDDGGYKQASITYFYANYPYDWGFLSNHIHCVDIPGEWYYDGKTLYIIPPEGVLGEDLTVSVKQGFTSFDLTYKRFIELHNISIRAASVTMAGDLNNNVINGGHQFIGNTVYSTGAHAFDSNNSGNANSVNPMLPMEIAYNHFLYGKFSDILCR